VWILFSGLHSQNVDQVASLRECLKRPTFQSISQTLLDPVRRSLSGAAHLYLRRRLEVYRWRGTKRFEIIV
jgi:hypothetical protein